MVTPVVRTAAHRISRGPRRSSSVPIVGEKIAARMPPSETAPDSAVRDQPNSDVMGSTKIDSVATAGPAREIAAQQTQARITQP